jgi:beta-1,4-mannosyl-glycoprotein beta-1,4-N-acetylglucosaminyltransferase
MKKYDTFIFFNELDLLDIRLNILNDYVDYFVLVEGTKTFTGIDKPLYYSENKDRFEQFNHKIVHIVVDDMPDSFGELSLRNGDALDAAIRHDCLTTTNVPRGQVHWLREFYQKEHIKKGIVSADDEDFIFISDLDEIWDPDLIYDFNSCDNLRLNQRVFSFFLNLESSERWYGTVGTKYKNIKNYSINHIRTPNRNQYTLIENAGWHFTFQGGESMIKEKIESYGHQEYNTIDIKGSISANMRDGIDVFRRNFNLKVNNDHLPSVIRNNLHKYSHMIK